MAFDRMSSSVLQRQHDDFVLREVVFRKLHRSVEDRQHVLGFQLLRLGIRSMTFQADRVRLLRAQQVFIVTAVRLMADRTTLLEHRLVQMRLLELVRLVGMASKACAYRIRLQKSRSASGVRIVAGDAFSLSSWMRDFGLVDLLGLVAVARHAECLVSVLVRTTLPSFAGEWQTSHDLSANGGCVKVCISFGCADWCGL